MRESAAGASTVDELTWQTLQSLPPLERPYSDYDVALMSEILTLAELQALEAAAQGKGAHHARPLLPPPAGPQEHELTCVHIVACVDLQGAAW